MLKPIIIMSIWAGYVKFIVTPRVFHCEYISGRSIRVSNCIYLLRFRHVEFHHAHHYPLYPFAVAEPRSALARITSLIDSRASKGRVAIAFTRNRFHLSLYRSLTLLRVFKADLNFWVNDQKHWFTLHYYYCYNLLL